MFRWQLFEFEDYAWYPNIFRIGQTSYLRLLMEYFDVFNAAIPILEDLVANSKHKNIIDLCSGGGGTMYILWKKYTKKSKTFNVTLSDLYPNLPAFKAIKTQTNGNIDYIDKPINALNIPSHITGIRTIFNGFHHFSPPQAKMLLQNAIDKQTPIGIFEPFDKNPLSLLINILSTSVLLFLLMPFAKPFRWTNILFTYLIPIIPIATCWDGIASYFRLYDYRTLEKFATEVDTSKQFVWKAGVASHTFGKVTYLIGYPKQQDN